MSDFNSSLPVRTETNGDVAVKIVDGTNPALEAQVSGNRLHVSQVALDSSTDSVEVVATDLDIRDLTFAQDKVDASGSVVALDAGTLAALESITVQNGAGGAAVNIQDGGNSITVDAVDLDIRYLTAASDSVKAQIADGSGNYFSVLNPVPVAISVDLTGQEVNDPNQSTNTAAAASSNHDYTVPAAQTLILTQFSGTASGKAKFVLQVETGVATNTFTNVDFKFNSTANPNVGKELKAPVTVLTGVRVRVIRTNLDLLPQDLYSVISGNLV